VTGPRSPTIYDRIGDRYTAARREDPRLAAPIHAALGSATSVVNVGAGTGSYEPRDRRVVAVEPSQVMLAQRPASAAPTVQALAEALPFVTGAFDAAMAVLTVHHWGDRSSGLAEMRRVARGPVVVFTWDPETLDSYWAKTDYFPMSGRFDVERSAPIPELVAALGGAEVIPIPIPWDCQDGFYGAYWRRPSALLDPVVWQGVSALALIPEHDREAGMRRLAADVESGAWERRYPHLGQLDELDLGYRLLVARGG
jgi:SAM-dependent methyltransferase